jgi:hypothetical protein
MEEKIDVIAAVKAGDPISLTKAIQKRQDLDVADKNGMTPSCLQWMREGWTS